MELRSKLFVFILLLSAFIPLVYSSQSCLSGTSTYNYADAWTPLSYDQVDDYYNCDDIWNYYNNPDTTFVSGRWVAFYHTYYNSWTSLKDTRMGYVDPFYTRDSAINFTNGYAYYPIYSYIFDINTSETKSQPIYLHAYNYNVKDRGSTPYSFTANLTLELVNTSLCSEGKCNIYKIEAEPISYTDATIEETWYGGASNQMHNKNKFTVNGESIMDSGAIPKSKYPTLPETYTAITPTFLDTLIYVMNPPDMPYGIFVEYNGTKYLITAGLDSQESFYSDPSLRHYIKCNLLNANSPYRGVFIHAEGINYYMDVGQFCIGESIGNDTNDTGGGIGTDYNFTPYDCGDSYINHTAYQTFYVTGNSTKPILIWYKLSNESWESIATTANYSYTLTNITEVHIFCDTDIGQIEINAAFEGGADIIGSDGILKILVVFTVLLGLMLITKHFGYAIMLSAMLLYALQILGFLVVSTSFIVGYLIAGAIIYWVMTFNIGGAKK